MFSSQVSMKKVWERVPTRHIPGHNTLRVNSNGYNRPNQARRQSKLPGRDYVCFGGLRIIQK